MPDTFADVDDLVRDYDYKPSINVKEGDSKNLLIGIKNIIIYEGYYK